MPVPSTAMQRGADVPPRSGSREPARRIASQGRPYADRPAAGPVALASAQASAVIVDMAVLQERARIAREALSNVARHACARHVDVEPDVGALDFTLRIIDDGRGFDPALPTPGHFGLRSIRERAHAVGGTVQVTSAEGHGTCIRVRIPREGGA